MVTQLLMLPPSSRHSLRLYIHMRLRLRNRLLSLPRSLLTSPQPTPQLPQLRLRNWTLPVQPTRTLR